MRRSALAVALAACLLAAPAAVRAADSSGGATAPAASATTAADPNGLSSPPTLDRPPPFRQRSANDVRVIADRLADVRAARSGHPRSYAEVFLKGTSLWQVSYFVSRRDRREIAQVQIDDATGAVREHWTGPQVAWTMARGYPGAFGRKVNEPWIWIPLAVVFVVPFIDRRRLLRWFHLDLLVLSGFSVSIAFFNDGNIDASVPIAYPLLGYLLVRLVVIAVRRPRGEPTPGAGLPLLVPAAWLAIACVFLLAFRIGLNTDSSNVIDVGYSGVIGAQHLLDGDRIYGAFPSDNPQGDTYGPVAYESYVPAVAVFGWSGIWDDLPAAHAAAILFDLLAILLLFLIGRRIRGPDLGIALAYAWLAYPFTIFASNTNTNDALVTVLVLLALLVAGRPALTGASAALAGLTKFAPLGLAPVLATHGLDAPPGRIRRLALFAGGFGIAAAIACLPLLREDLSMVWDRTIGFQSGRGSPFSIWGLYGWDAAQRVAQVGAVVLGLALAIAGRRGRDLAGLAAACGAILIALQLGVSHWFYLYVVWFFPLVMIAGLAREAPATAAARAQPPAAAVTSSAPRPP